LFLDVDGTLLDIAVTPDQVVVPAMLPSTLDRLRRPLCGAVALVTGRSLASVDALIGRPSIDAAGCHGGEFRVGGRLLTDLEDESTFGAVATRLFNRLRTTPGAIVELKPVSVAFHYRSSTLTDAQARDLAAAAVAPEGDTLRLIAGKKVIEIMPEGVGKGAAIARFMELPPYRGRQPVFVGDDVTDEEGFAEVNRRGGISIRVGTERASLARFCIASVAACLEWLSGSVLGHLEAQGEKTC
jgi:trehalose 6-phosphate phosphatase